MKETRFFQWSTSFGALALLLLASSVGGSGGCGAATGMSSPPVNIPAPVAGLSISTPTTVEPANLRVSERKSQGIDQEIEQMSQIDGRAGSCEAGAALTVTNSDTGETVTSTCQGDGSIDLEIAAEIGHDLEITLGTGVTGTRTVRNNNVVSANLVETVTVSPSRNLGFAHHSDGTDSFIDVYDMANDFAFQSTLTVENFVFVHAAFHDDLNRALIPRRLAAGLSTL